MINQFAEAITSFLLQEKVIKEEEQEIYQYGTEQILINLTTFIAIGTIASIANMWGETFFFLVGMIPIRTIAGGFHAKTPLRCNVLTFSVYVLNMLMISFLKNCMTFQVMAILTCVIQFGIFKYAPVEHKNRMLDKEECLKARIQSRIIGITLSIMCIIIAVIFTVNNFMIISTMMGATTASMSLVIGSIQKGGRRNEKVKYVA